MNFRTVTVISLLSLTLVACGKKEVTAISFANDIQPILNQHCMECHKNGGQGQTASGLSMESYASLMKGTKFGPIIKPGDALSSTLVRLVKGLADPSIKMPHGNRKSLNDSQISKIETWINQGAKNN